MYLQIGLILILIFFTIVPEMSFGQTSQSTQNSAPSRENLDSSESEKIDEILSKWQNSENPEEYAKQLDLAYKGDKIAVYIYLENPEFESKIPSEIEKLSANKNIVRAFVTSEELYDLEKLDFVTKITPPIKAEKLPISQEEQPQNQDQNNSFFWILIPSILVIVTIVVLKTKNKIS